MFFLKPLAITLALSGCLGTPDPQLLTQADLDAFNLNFAAAETGSYNGPVPTGTATYSGHSLFYVSRTDGVSDFRAAVLGDIGMDVNFDTSTITGSIDNMVMGDEDGNTSNVGGSLVVDASGYGTVRFPSADVDGMLSMYVDGSARNVTMDMALAGIIRDNPALADTITGTLTGTGSGDVSLVLDSGSFYATD